MIALARWTAIVGLVAAGAYGIHLHRATDDSAASAVATQPITFDREAAEQQLRERFDVYVELRKQDDWGELYRLVDPVERELVDLRKFLSFYGSGYIKTHGIWIEDIAFDWDAGTAAVQAVSHAELQVEKLPPQYQGMKLETENDTHVEAPHEVTWVRRGGEWYFQLDRQIVAGQQADGRVPKAF